jgi:hypothetical protein
MENISKIPKKPAIKPFIGDSLLNTARKERPRRIIRVSSGFPIAMTTGRMTGIIQKPSRTPVPTCRLCRATTADSAC